MKTQEQQIWQENLKLKAGYPPFIRSSSSIKRVMFSFCLFLMLPVAAAIYFFGMKALMIIALSVISSVVADLFMKKIRHKKIQLDGSELITGILFALTLPPKIPLYVPVIGSLFAIIVVKHIFGGLGNNIFNPALAARAFIGASWPLFISTFAKPYSFLSSSWFSLSIDSSLITSATPLSQSASESFTSLTFSSLFGPFFGNISGSIGETSAFLILIAAIGLISTKIIDWRITIPYISTVFIGGFIYSFFLGANPFYFSLYYIFTGGLMLGAVFMATDYVTSPTTKNGRLLFAFGCGILTLLFRIFSSMPEGVAYSILLMNAISPLLDRYTYPKPFGWRKQEK
jgi:Na+-translocating ferredoxin:NAD+ oxidoreductase subunit D